MAQFTPPTSLIGSSLAIWKVKAYLRKVAMTDSQVLITGETGTGKELAAQYIHHHSARRAKPLVTINCAALPDGLLESELFGYERGAFTGAVSSYSGKLKLADGGTVLFDEIGDMSPYAQAKILRVIETREVYPLGGRRNVPLDIRIIAATNRSLDQRMVNNEFRQDLYFRLNVARVHLPPLRERRDDIQLLIDHCAQKFAAQLGRGIEGFSDEAMELLLRYDWPGNIRELMNLIERIFIDPPQEKITVADLPESMRFCSSVRHETLPAEREILLYTLSQTNWNKTQAAERLHWSRMTLYRKIAKYHIVPSHLEATETPAEPTNRRNNFAVSVTKCNKPLLRSAVAYFLSLLSGSGLFASIAEIF
jgi:transcriptional regulator with PAS, ATPase and Fis domain